MKTLKNNSLLASKDCEARKRDKGTRSARTVSTALVR